MTDPATKPAEANAAGYLLTDVQNDLVQMNIRAVEANQNVNLAEDGESGDHGDETPPPTIQEILAELDGSFPMDEAVMEVVPEGSTFVSVESFGNSAWTITGRLITTDASGEESHYFLKVAYGEHGRIMLNGEWESSKLIHGLAPDFIPEPIGFGRYKIQTPATYFYLQAFVDMDITTAPEPEEWGEKLANMHKASESPTGKFGFHVTTCDGKMAHVVDWEDEWPVFFGKLIRGVCKLEKATNGEWPEFELAQQQLVEKVVPRLLGNLRETHGGKIEPRIIHGDLYEGNVGINMETGQVLLFDAGSYYAHNEMELGHWRSEFSSAFRAKTYVRHYLRNYPASSPVEEFDDRNRLYSLKGAINYAAGHPGSPLRKTAYNNMCYLIEKYAPIDGIDKYDPALDPSVTGVSIVPHASEGLF